MNVYIQKNVINDLDANALEIIFYVILIKCPELHTVFLGHGSLQFSKGYMRELTHAANVRQQNINRRLLQLESPVRNIETIRNVTAVSRVFLSIQEE